MTRIKDMFRGLFLTLFPPLCSVCSKKLKVSEQFLCPYCIDNMPLTYNWRIPRSALFMRINNTIEIEGAVSLFHYTLNDNYKNLIIDSKFRNQRKLAIELGRWMAFFFESNEELKCVDLIIPIPLHRSRETWRGYNQSVFICRGLSEVMNIPMNTNAVIRHKKSKTQSRLRGNTLRQENVRDIFSVLDVSILANKSILLVDDVITTGATISSCIKAIKKAVPSCKIYACFASSVE